MANGVDLFKQMQLGGDFQNVWLMFDHVKRVEEWTTMVCHIQDPIYYKVFTIAIYNMQFESMKHNVSCGQNSTKCCLGLVLLIPISKIHGRQRANNYNVNCLQFWKSLCEDGWQGTNLLFPLDSFIWQTRERIDYIKFPIMAQGIVLQLQNTTSFEEVDVQYVVIWFQWYFFRGSS